tara:strand:- start:703 stop:1194 length:492 start_codon:yes stop_codon:yes gene_type:complete
MTTPTEYTRFVLQKYRRGLIEFTQDKNPLEDGDTLKKWNMKKIATCNDTVSFWDVGFLHRGQLAYQQNPRHTGFSPSYFFPRTMPPPKYWWCRDADWLPRWGKATKQRAQLMKEMRTYWMKKWFDEKVPAIKQKLLEITPLPEDIVEHLSDYFEYPYQIKSIN